MTINLADNNPRIEYTVAQGVVQTVFTVPFEYFEDADVSIYVDGVKKSLGADYTLSGGNGSTGVLTFVTAVPPAVQQITGAVGGSEVSIVRSVALERTTDFAASGYINRVALNTQLDTIVAQVADLDDRVSRSLHLNDSVVGPDMLLTDARKGKIISFNETTGAVETNLTITDFELASDAVELSTAQAVIATEKAAEAAVSANAAAADAVATAADAVATAADRVQTGLDAVATAADRAAVEGIASDVLLESDLTSVVSVKALNQGVATTDSPTFAGLTSGDATFNTSGNAGFSISSVNPALKLTDTDTSESSRLWHAGTSLYVDNTGTGNTIFRNGATNTQRVNIKTTGDVAFRDDTGATESFYWDASAESLGLGTTTPSSTLDVVGNAEINGNITVTGTVDGRDVAVDGVTLDGLEAQYDASKVIYQVSPAVPERVGNPSWFPSGGAPYLNTIISADGPSGADRIWRSVLVGDSSGSAVTSMSQAVAVGNGALRFSGVSDATTAVGSLSMQWLGLAIDSGEDINDAMVRTRHDFVWDWNGTANVGKRLDDVAWDAFGLETNLPGTRAKLNAVSIPQYDPLNPKVAPALLEGNTAIGRNSGLHMVNGYDNTIVGRNALAHGFDSDENVAIGNRALRDGALANQNVAVGTAAGQSFIEGSDNIFIGDHAGFNATTGSNNLMLGSWAGDGFTGAVSNNLFIGMGTGATPIVSGSFSNGRVGINVDYADHLGSGLHVRSGTTATGATPNVASDALVIEESGANSGISILTGNTWVGQINFGDPENNNDGYLRYDHSTRGMTLGAASAARLTIDSSGHTIIPAGVTLGTAAGVYEAANTLDDYEEGTFTPEFSAGGSSTATYDTQLGTYTKVGNLVTVNVTLKATALGAMSGVLSVAGLPFTSSGFGAATVGYGVNLAVTAGTAVTGYVNSDRITMREWNAAGGTTSMTPANLSATAYLIMSATYKTDE